MKIGYFEKNFIKRLMEINEISSIKMEMSKMQNPKCDVLFTVSLYRVSQNVCTLFVLPVSQQK
jgi:hypothetical protein